MKIEKLFCADDRMADLVFRCHKLILIVPRFGILWGFGDKTVKQVCISSHIDVGLFLEICNMHAFNDYVPHSVGTSELYLSGLVNYLEISHRYYRKERMPHISNHLKRLAECFNDHEGHLLLHFFSEYLEEADKHFAYEETVVFPYVRDLSKGKVTPSFAIHDFEDAHSDIEEKLVDLTSIIIKYLPGNPLQEERTSILLDLFNLSTDLQAHTRIENRILVSVAHLMENDFGK